MAADVMVFAPAPLLTVTIEQSADAVELHVHPGGQGIWQARMITSLGASVTVCACLGGEVGAVLEPLILAEGVQLRSVPRNPSNGWYVHDRRDGDRVEVADSPGQPLERHDLDELYGLALAEGLGSEISVLSGPAEPTVVPADVYRRLAADLGANGARVVADLSGEYLPAVLDGGVHFLKVSHEELIEDGLADGDDVEAVVAALHRLHDDGAGSVIVTRAERSSIALLDGDLVEVTAPRLQAADPKGAGDSMTAGVAAVLARGGDLTDAVRTGAAAGAHNVTRHGLGTGRAEAIAALVTRVRIEPLGNSGGRA
ncbi:MAG: 1-phosphofructokinase family hexose kinase [Jiangellaceae bacterium]